MRAITVILHFEDGEDVVCIGPEQPIPESELESVHFSEPHSMPDISLREMAGFEFQKVTEH